MSSVVPLREKYNGNWPKVVLIGDSTTRWACYSEFGHWTTLLAYNLKDYFDVNFRGITAGTTRIVRQSLTKIYPKQYLQKVELIIIFLGLNDSFQGYGNSVPYEEFQSNVSTIIEYFKENGVSVSKLLFITPLHYDPSVADNYNDPDWWPVHKSREYGYKFIVKLREIVKEYGADMVDFHEIAESYRPYSDIYYDGQHLSDIGAKLLFAVLWPQVKQKLESNFNRKLSDLHHVPCIEEIKKNLE